MSTIYRDNLCFHQCSDSADLYTLSPRGQQHFHSLLGNVQADVRTARGRFLTSGGVEHNAASSSKMHSVTHYILLTEKVITQQQK